MDANIFMNLKILIDNQLQNMMNLKELMIPFNFLLDDNFVSGLANGCTSVAMLTFSGDSRGVRIDAETMTTLQTFFDRITYLVLKIS